MEATNLADLYGSPLLDWSRIEARLRSGLSQAPGTGTGGFACWSGSARIVHDDQGAYFEITLA